MLQALRQGLLVFNGYSFVELQQTMCASVFRPTGRTSVANYEALDWCNILPCLYDLQRCSVAESGDKSGGYGGWRVLTE